MARRAKERMSIVTVASFGQSSRYAWRIAIARTAGSTVTLTNVGSVTKGGMNFIPSPALRQILETNGSKVTEVTQESGNE